MSWQPFLGTILFLVAFAALLLGIEGLRRRKPIVVTGTRLATIVTMATVALMGLATWVVFEHDRTIAGAAGFACSAVLCAVVVRAVFAAEKSCLVFGTTRRWVRWAVRASLFRMSIPFVDEGFEHEIPVSTGRNRIRVRHRWMRYRPLHVVRTSNVYLSPLQDDLADAMGDYFRNNVVYTDSRAFAALTSTGAVLLACDALMLIRWLAP